MNQLPKFKRRKCEGGHDTIRDSPAMWITDNRYVSARYSCIVCGYFWNEPDERPSDPQPSKFHAE